jgi:hypothetical protein
MEFNSCALFGWFDSLVYAWTNIMFIDEDEDTIVELYQAV